MDQRQKIKSFRDLEVWQVAMDLVDVAYDATDKLPRSEDWGLKTQMRRAAASVAWNIAEGHRKSTASYIYHLGVSSGEEAELETQFEICRRRKFLSEAEVNKALELGGRVAQILNKLIQSLGG